MLERRRRIDRALFAVVMEVYAPGDVILVARVMGLLSGLGRTLDSRTDLFDALLPHLDPDAEAVG